MTVNPEMSQELCIRTDFSLEMFPLNRRFIPEIEDREDARKDWAWAQTTTPWVLGSWVKGLPFDKSYEWLWIWTFLHRDGRYCVTVCIAETTGKVMQIDSLLACAELTKLYAVEQPIERTISTSSGCEPLPCAWATSSVGATWPDLWAANSCFFILIWGIIRQFDRGLNSTVNTFCIHSH